MSKFIEKVNLDDEYTQVELDVTTTNKVNELVDAYNDGDMDGEQGIKGVDGNAIYRLQNVATISDTSGTLPTAYIFLNGRSPQVGDLLIDKNGKMGVITSFNGVSTVGYTFYTNVKGEKGDTGNNGVGFARRVENGDQVYLNKPYMFIGLSQTDEGYISAGIYDTNDNKYTFVSDDEYETSVFKTPFVLGVRDNYIVSVTSANGYVETSLSSNTALVFNSGEYDCYLLELS